MPTVLRLFLLGGLRGGPLVGKTQARNPTDRPKVDRGPPREGDLGAAAGSVPMRTTCVTGISGVCDARVIGGAIHHILLFFLVVFPISKLKFNWQLKGQVEEPNYRFFLFFFFL